MSSSFSISITPSLFDEGRKKHRVPLWALLFRVIFPAKERKSYQKIRDRCERLRGLGSLLRRKKSKGKTDETDKTLDEEEIHTIWDDEEVNIDRKVNIDEENDEEMKGQNGEEMKGQNGEMKNDCEGGHTGDEKISNAMKFPIFALSKIHLNLDGEIPHAIQQEYQVFKDYTGNNLDDGDSTAKSFLDGTTAPGEDVICKTKQDLLDLLQLNIFCVIGIMADTMMESSTKELSTSTLSTTVLESSASDVTSTTDLGEETYISATVWQPSTSHGALSAGIGAAEASKEAQIPEELLPEDKRQARVGTRCCIGFEGKKDRTLQNPLQTLTISHILNHRPLSLVRKNARGKQNGMAVLPGSTTKNKLNEKSSTGDNGSSGPSSLDALGVDQSNKTVNTWEHNYELLTDLLQNYEPLSNFDRQVLWCLQQLDLKVISRLCSEMRESTGCPSTGCPGMMSYRQSHIFDKTVSDFMTVSLRVYES